MSDAFLVLVEWTALKSARRCSSTQARSVKVEFTWLNLSVGSVVPTGLDAGWRERMPLIQLRQHLAVITQYDDDWGAAELVRTTLAPFRRSRA